MLRAVAPVHGEDWGDELQEMNGSVSGATGDDGQATETPGVSDMFSGLIWL